jgi:hypothetical protein
MSTFRAVLVATLALTLMPAAPGVADEEEEWELELREETGWFACDGDTREDTINRQLENDTPTWDTEEPTGSWVEGDGGCGSLHATSLVGGTEQESPYDLSFAGEFDGNLDTITVTLHNAYLGTNRGTGTQQMIEVRLTIDNLSVFGVEERTGYDLENLQQVTHTQPARRPMPVIPEPAESSEGITETFTFSITGLDYLTEDDDTTHRVVLTVATGFNLGNFQSAWAWGAVETPSSLTFNTEVEPDRWNAAIPRDEREPHDED